MTTVAADSLRPVGFRRLIDVHLRIWLTSRAVLISTVVALAIGVAATTLVITPYRGQLTVDSVRDQMRAAEAGFGLLWPIIGAAAAASAFSSRWATLVLVVAPRWIRWLAGSLCSFLLVAASAAVLFVSWLVSALSGAGFDPAQAVLGRIGS
jgi:hypothetical protein